MGLTPAQDHIAKLVLAMGDLDLHLAGGAALIVHEITDRKTKDLDTFLSETRDTHAVAENIRALLASQGMEVKDVSHTPHDTLRKFAVTLPNGDTVSLDIGRDLRLLPGEVTRVGMALSRVELGANKLVSLYGDPSRARDVDDIARALTHFSMEELLEVADRKESAPLDREMLAYALYQASQLKDDEYPEGVDVASVKKFAVAAALHFRDGTPLPTSPYAPTNSVADVGYHVVSTSTGSGRCGAPRKRGGACQRRVALKGCPYH